MNWNAKPILAIRLGAMGDIIHALPAVASLKKSFPLQRLVWAVAPKWIPLLEGNPYVDELLPFQRKGWTQVSESWKRLRQVQPDLAVDFQGLVQSALVGRAAAARCFVGLDGRLAREWAASLLYNKTVHAVGPHRVQRCLQLAEAAGAKVLTHEAWIPEGSPEGELPTIPFVLANPFAGWVSKQWPLEFYDQLGALLVAEGYALVANVPEARAGELCRFRNLHPHVGSLAGLIDATRKATAVIGVDSGPLHLAAALHKRGVAIYGPTDPAQTGPYNSAMKVLRADNVRNSYKREDEIHPSMKSISVEMVADALRTSLLVNS
jgi:heptosyltransferase I